jgi:hypothetical protein
MVTKSNVSRANRSNAGGKSGGKAAAEPCACCGIAPGPNGQPLSVTFEQPDVVFQIEPELLQTWGADPFIAVKDVGFFIRVILPLRLSDGFAVDFGTWLEVHSDTFKEAWKAWNFPEYKDLVVEGYLANTIAPLGEFPFALTKAVVRAMDEVPYVDTSASPEIIEMLARTWPHAEILQPFADLLRQEAPPTA